MAIVDEIERIKTNIADAYTELETKSAMMPTERNSENLKTTIASVSAGTTGGSIEKGIIIEECDSEGYVTKVKVVGMSSIPSYAFSRNSTSENNILSTKLQSVTLPEELTSIGAYAFRYNSNLGPKLTLPIGVNRLNTYVFYYCDSLEELTCLGNMTSFLNYCLSGCSKLTKLILPNMTKAPSITAYSFADSTIVSGTCTVYVPDSLVASFQSASVWKNYQIKPISELEG